MQIDRIDPAGDQTYRVLGNDGNLLRPDEPRTLSDLSAAEAMKRMLFARTADLMAVSYQRQGRMYTYPPNLGQEAISAAAGMVMRPDDWFVSAFREMGAWLARGVTLKELFLFFRGHEDGSRFQNAVNVLPVSVPIASQLLHAAGIGYGIRYKGEDRAVIGVVGDGGTSEGDFHEALNFAAVWKAPVVFLIQNNQFAISVPLRKQTASVNLAVKAIGYGMPGIKVDGNDIFAMHEVLTDALNYARTTGPVLVEAVTYRKGAHTTSDDPTRYRTREEEEQWEQTDPLNRLRNYLVSKGLWSEADEAGLVEETKREIDRQFSEAENYPPYPLEDVFRFMYKEMPDDLKRQQIEYEKFLNWKEARK